MNGTIARHSAWIIRNAVLRVYCAVLLVLSLISPVISAGNGAEPAIAFAARIVGDANRFRLIVDFDKKITHKAYVLDSPKRLIIDLSDTVFSLDDSAANSPSPLVTDFRRGTIAPGKSRIVLSLGEPATLLKQDLKALEGGTRHRLILDAKRASQDEFASAALKGAEQQAGGRVSYKGDRIERADKKAEKFVIVVDPGHGGIDGGAVGAGKTVEKDVTLQFALALRDKLKDHPALTILLTRETDTFVSLVERVAIARRNHADLMISVHADSLRQKNIRGATIYTLSEDGSDELSKELADEQNRSDLIAGLDIPRLDESVSDILIDLTRRETETFSTRFADMLVDQMKKQIKLIKNPHRSADFYVLRAAEIPSVLLELGYLSNKRDEKLMRSREWVLKTADNVQQAALKFFAPRMAAQ